MRPPAEPDEARARAWLSGWDPTPGIVSVWAEPDGRTWVWRRDPHHLTLQCEQTRFRPFLIVDNPYDMASDARFSVRELEGDGVLRFVVHGPDLTSLTEALLRSASRRFGTRLRHLRELGPEHVLALPPEEQYLVASGRTYFRGLTFDQLARLTLDLETTGLDPRTDRVFLAALRAPDGTTETLEADAVDDAGERRLVLALTARIRALDPDVIENHNLHGFDVPFLVHRAAALGIALDLGRLSRRMPSERPSARGSVIMRDAADFERRQRKRYTVPGRELIDTMDAVRRYDFATRELPSMGLKAVAKHLGIGGPERTHVPGARVFEVYRADPERVRRYAVDDVIEAAGVSRMLGGSTFALASMAPRRYERLSDAGPATGVLDPLLVRAYLHEAMALPAHQRGDGTAHSGAALHLFAEGVAEHIVKADVASLYPSLMRTYRIGPARDRLGVLVSLVERLVDLRLEAKQRAKFLPKGSPERHANEAMSAAMKLVVNSAYGYLGAVGLTRFADVHAANEVTRRGRELLDFVCRELAMRGVTLLEADTDGVYFAVPEATSEDDERRIVREVDALLPEHVRLEFDGRYRAMLSHEPKNYALLPYDDEGVLLRGVAFRSSRAEPFGEAFLKAALARLLRGDVAGAREVYVATCTDLRRRRLPTRDVTTRVRLTKTPEEYLAQRKERRALPYEALLSAGRTHWSLGERIRVYRRAGGLPGLFREDRGGPRDEGEALSDADTRDYDVEYYLRLLRETFATRLAKALTPEDYLELVADPEQPSLFARSLEGARPVLTRLSNS